MLPTRKHSSLKVMQRESPRQPILKKKLTKIYSISKSKELDLDNRRASIKDISTPKRTSKKIKTTPQTVKKSTIRLPLNTIGSSTRRKKEITVDIKG